MARRREDEDEDEDDEDVPDDEPRRRRPEDDDEDEPLGRRSDDEEEEPRPRRPKRRKKRRRAIARPAADESSGFTIQGGWLDGIFGSDNMLILIALCAGALFVCPCMLPVALFAAITASDSDARRNALIVLGVCVLPLVCGGVLTALGRGGH